MSPIAALEWIGARARWVLALGVLIAMFLPALASILRPALPGLVALVVALAMARLDLPGLARRAARPRRLCGLLVWSLALLVLTPAVLWAGGRILGLPPDHLAALVYTGAAPPITSAASLCLMMGLDAALALEITIFASLATPLIGPAVVTLLLGQAVPLDAVDLGIRIAAMIAAGTLGALALRRLAGPERIARNARVFDGVAALAMLTFIIPVFDGVPALIAEAPRFALATFALAVLGNFGLQILVAQAARRALPPGSAGAAGLLWGNRTVALYLAALPHDPAYALYCGLYQFPMLMTPLLMRRVLAARK